jgi:hypothetical protein
MTAKAVFRVQCDGPCKGWLSLPDACTPGSDIRYVDLETRPTAVRAGMWPGERSARRAAQGSGWTVRPGMWLCPPCALNPLGIRLPPPGIERFENGSSAVE